MARIYCSMRIVGNNDDPQDMQTCYTIAPTDDFLLKSLSGFYDLLLKGRKKTRRKDEAGDYITESMSFGYIEDSSDSDQERTEGKS